MRQQKDSPAPSSSTSIGANSAAIMPLANAGRQQQQQHHQYQAQRRQRVHHGPRRWTLLTPTVLWSVVILAMAPSFYGFGLGSVPSGRAGTAIGSDGASSRGGQQRGGVASAAELASGGANAIAARRSPFAAASWLKERVRDGTRKVHMQVWYVVML